MAKRRVKVPPPTVGSPRIPPETALNGTGKSHENGNERIDNATTTSDVIVRKCRISIFFLVPAVICYSYVLLVVVWYGTSNLCPETLLISDSSGSIKLHNKINHDESSSIASHDETCTDETSGQKKERHQTLYDLYHFKEIEQEKLLEVEHLSVPNEHQHSFRHKSSRSICNNSATISFAVNIGKLIPSYIFKQRRMDMSLAFDQQKASDHQKVHNVLKHHPFKRAMLAAATFVHRKILKRGGHGKKVTSKRSKKVQPLSNIVTPSSLTTKQRVLVSEMSKRVLTLADDPNFHKRVSAVPWGGPQRRDHVPFRYWWSPVGSSKEMVDGFNILISYLIIMQWPENLIQKFPGRMCPEGCPCEKAILHSIEYREKYKPWIVSPLVVKEGRDGWIYHRGFSKDRHSMVWFRPGHHFVDNIEGYIRAILYTMETAVADAYIASDGVVGKYNFVVDCDNFSFSMIPKISHVKKMFAFLQDHFPNRTGVIFIANLAGAAQLFLKMIRPLLHEAVKRKIQIIPTEANERDKMLREFVDPEHIPAFLNGKDDWVFNVNEYYGPVTSTDQEALEYLVTMPYHAH